MKDIIVGIGAVVGALLAVVTLVLTIARPLRRFIKDHKAADAALAAEIQEIRDWIAVLEQRQRETWMETLRHKIFSGSLPLTERVNAGKLYLDHGGNGAAAVKHEKNVQRLREITEADEQGCGGSPGAPAPKETGGNRIGTT